MGGCDVPGSEAEREAASSVLKAIRLRGYVSISI